MLEVGRQELSKAELPETAAVQGCSSDKEGLGGGGSVSTALDAQV